MLTAGDAKISQRKNQVFLFQFLEKFALNFENFVVEKRELTAENVKVSLTKYLAKEPIFLIINLLK